MGWDGMGCASLHPTYTINTINITILSGICFLLFLLFSFPFVVFALFFFYMLSFELGNFFSDIFLSNRPRTGLATACIPGYG